MKQNNDLLQTPFYIWKTLGEINLDPCAGQYTVIGGANWWIGRGDDGLKKTWYGFVFCNPPFSQKEIWIEKMIEHGNGILLLPERGSAPWFGPLAKACGKYFVMGKKINFEGGSSSNNVGSVMFLFGHDAVCRIKKSGLPGHLASVEFYNKRN